MEVIHTHPSSPESESLDRDFVSDVNTTEVPSQFAELYKSLARNSEASQAERRELFLREIKRRRHEIFDERRNIDDEKTDESEEMEVEEKRKRKRKRKYANRLMFTEWLCEVPHDLEENWFVKFCPYGKRCLVVAEKYKTASYNRRGELIGTKFQSFLPGGNRSGQRNTFTVLECLYSRDLKCFFVLDVLYWNSMSMQHQSVEFRFFWLCSKFADTPEFSIISDSNKYKFYHLDYAPATTAIVSGILSSIPRLEEKTFLYDGILFYHKESVYISGFTPLVTWLKPYMVPEVFGCDVNEVYMQKKPNNYDSYQEFIRKLPSQKNVCCEVDMTDVDIT